MKPLIRRVTERSVEGSAEKMKNATGGWRCVARIRFGPGQRSLEREPLVGFEPTTARLRIESSTPELQWRDLGLPDYRCPGADSNRDAFRHYPLKIACLPVSPPGRADEDSGIESG